MTENEAIRELERNCCYELSKCREGYCLDENCFVETAIQALEEIQQYRAIGTIEEFKDLKEEVQLYRNLDKTNFSDGYAKAVDEFVEKAYFILGCEDSDIYCKESIKEIAEQLKAGDNNE